MNVALIEVTTYIDILSSVLNVQDLLHSSLAYFTKVITFIVLITPFKFFLSLCVVIALYDYAFMCCY
jgi:hypothetical protein